MFLGDEFYIVGERPIPSAEHYREFPQIENGVGMVRTFEDDFDGALEEFGGRISAKGLSGTVATGRLFAPFLERAIRRLGCDLRVVPVRSEFWGGGINVTGLLTGSDFVSGLKGKINGDVLLLPSESMIGDDGLFLDDMKLADVEREMGVRTVRAGYTASEFLETLSTL